MIDRLYSPLKRTLDAVLAGIALLVLSPLLLVIAVVSRLRLGPPVLFRQQRPGLHGAMPRAACCPMLDG
jgi:lipopolysaccharide/colanic/teichoic acid biosynthesis glycosyltransferase